MSSMVGRYKRQVLVPKVVEDIARDKYWGLWL